MSDALQYTNQVNPLHVCVIIPTYNNNGTLQQVIDGVLYYTRNIIVVNDGATDTTGNLLKNYSTITVITFTKNRGKGAALRAGFAAARKAGYTHAITIDSDGQHFPDDIPVFLNYAAQDSNTLLIGSRNMAQFGVPKKSSFGNKFSNFWFWFETGNKLEDTQSGFRLYPLKIIPEKFYTNKFEFEIEVIVRSAWKGIPVKNVPVKVLYHPTERVSHFRPFTDFSRISVLNTILVFISLVYIKPRDLITNLKKKSLKRFFIENILHSDDSPQKKALSMALGVFIGIAPLWGFQTITVLFLAYILRLNKLTAFAFSNVSIPPFIPFIILASIKVGMLVIPGREMKSGGGVMDIINQNVVQYLTGSILLGTCMAAITGLIGYILLLTTIKNKVTIY